MKNQKPNYGIDAQGLVRRFLIGALILVAIVLLNFGLSLESWPKIAAVVILTLAL